MKTNNELPIIIVKFSVFDPSIYEPSWYNNFKPIVFILKLNESSGKHKTVEFVNANHPNSRINNEKLNRKLHNKKFSSKYYLDFPISWPDKLFNIKYCSSGYSLTHDFNSNKYNIYIKGILLNNVRMGRCIPSIKAWIIICKRLNLTCNDIRRKIAIIVYNSRYDDVWDYIGRFSCILETKKNNTIYFNKSVSKGIESVYDLPTIKVSIEFKESRIVD